MKTIKAVGTQSQTYSDIELDLEGLPKSAAAKVKRDVGEFLVEQISTTLAKASSPIEGESWPKLSKTYKKMKVAQGGVGEANMELTGALLDSLTFEPSAEGVRVGFFDSQAWKADGHLKFSGKNNNTPQRRFLPGKGQNFKDEIQAEVTRIVEDARVESTSIPKSELKSVDTKAELYTLLKEYLGEMSNQEMKLLVLRNAELVAELDELDLLDLLGG